jgi:hypothetical protein
MQIKFGGVIEVKLLDDIVKKLPNISAFHSTEHTVFIYGMGSKTRSFYYQLKSNPDVALLWSGWFTNKWWTYFLSFIAGESGLVKVLNRNNIFNLYDDIGGQSYCALCFVEEKLTQEIFASIIKLKTDFKLEQFLKNEKNYFVLNVDFDYHGGERDGELYYAELCYDDSLNEELVANLTLIKDAIINELALKN